MNTRCLNCGCTPDWHFSNGICPNVITKYQRGLTANEAVDLLRSRLAQSLPSPIPPPQVLNEADQLRLSALGVKW